MRWRAPLWCLVASCALLTTGCWSRIETNELAIVIAYGVDWRHGSYQVIASVLAPRAVGLPGQGGPSAQPNQPAHILMTGTGSTPGAAMASIDNRSSRRILWGSAQLMVVGQGLAEHGLAPLLRAVTHQPGFRPTLRLLIAHGSAYQLFAVDRSGLETSIGRDLFLMAQNDHRSNGLLWAPHVFDIYRWFTQQQRAFLIPGVTGSQPQLPQEATYRMPDSAVFAAGKAGQFVSWLPAQQVRIVLWIEGVFDHGYFTSACPGGPGAAVVHLTSGKRHLRALLDQAGQLRGIAVTLRAEGRIAQGCPQGTTPGVSTMASRLILQQAEQVIGWSKARHQDIFGFGEFLYRYHPELWVSQLRSDWPAIWAKLPVHLSVHVRIVSPGMTS